MSWFFGLGFGVVTVCGRKLQYQDSNASPPQEGQFDLNLHPNVSTFHLNKPATSK